MPKLTPNYLSVTSDGRISAKFTGGLILPVPSNNTPGSTTTSVTWTREEDGSWFARMRAGRTSISPPASNSLVTELQSPNTAHAASYFLEAFNSSPGGAISRMGVSADAQAATVLDSDGYSSFLTVNGPGSPYTRLRSFVCFVTFTWPGGTPFSNVIDLSAIAGYTVGASLATMPGDWQNRNFVCEPFHPAGGGSLIQAKATQGGGAVNPGGGVTNGAYVLAITG